MIKGCVHTYCFISVTYSTYGLLRVKRASVQTVVV